MKSKILLALAMLTAGITFGEYVSVINAKSVGGIIVEEEQVPVGSIQMWMTSTPPTGWVEMKGQSTSAYPLLASVIGGTIPDMRGVFARGYDNGRGFDAGRSLGSYQADEFKSHTHTQNIPMDGAGGANMQSLTSTANSDENWQQSGTTEATGGSETRPKNVALMYIIKAE